MKGSNIRIFGCVFVLGLYTSPLFAISPTFLPGSVEPGVVSKTLSAPSIQPQTETRPAITRPQQGETESALGPDATKIKFKLTKIILEGNRVYSNQNLALLYKDKINTTISIAELENIVQSITSYYRNNGYILSRAVLPPQHVSNGVVHIKILEGYISKVTVLGDPKRAKYILQGYGDRIAAKKPTQLNVMEYYLRLANELPGVSVRAVLEPSKTNQGASDMNLVAQTKTFDGYISYDDYGTRYIGPQQVTASISGNSVFQSGDSTHLTTVRTAKPLELQYVDLSHDFPIGTQGLRASLGANSSKTRPQFTLAPLKISGDALNAYTTIQYPLIRERSSDLTLTGGGNWIDSGVDSFDFTLYNDHIRSLKGGLNYNLSDSYKGVNTISGTLEHGFAHILGASSDPNSLTVSRFGADGYYTKINLNAGRLQSLFWRLSTFIYATGQYSFEPLLASAQFAFGGSQLGRGYDPAEIIGDKGAAGSVELRLDTAPGWFLLQTAQPYVFYDIGAIWNIKHVVNVPMKLSASSLGVGVRFVLTKNFSGNLMFAQPLTKQVAAEEIIGEGRKPRGFFSLVASV